METFSAVLFYPDTEEEEPDASLAALIDAKQLAFSTYYLSYFFQSLKYPSPMY